MHCIIYIQNPVYYCKFRHMQACSCPIQTCSVILWHIKSPEPCATPAYSERWHIQNPGIFITQEIFRTLSKHFPARCITLAYWEPFHIQNFATFKSFAYLRPEVYSESYLQRHIQPNSGIFINDSYNNNNFSFSNLILHAFQQNLKIQMFFWRQWRPFQCSTESTEIIRDLWK